MDNGLWNVNGSLSTHELVTRIRASVRERHGLRGAPLEGAGPTTSPAIEECEGGASVSIQAEVNQVLFRSLDLVTNHLEQLQTQVRLVDTWVRDETEESAQFHQEVTKQMGQLIRLVADLDARVKALEDRAAAARKPSKRLSWSHLARIAQPQR